MIELDDDTPIFRIYNFFDLINTLNSNSIRLSQTSRMEDANELFGIYFNLLRSAFGSENLDQFDRTQAQFITAKSHHYMTCWTCVADNIAVWSLYSPYKDAIQVQTTYGKLREAIFAHYEKHHYTLVFKLPPNDPQNLFGLPDVGPVKYIDFRETYSSLRQQCMQYIEERDLWIADRIKKGETMRPRGEEWVAGVDDIRARVFAGEQLGGPLLKDLRYQHEQEVRFVLSLRRRDGRTKEEYDAHPFAGLDAPWMHPPIEDCPPNLFVPFDLSNLSHVRVDGRVEGYKFEAISNALAKFGIETTRSSAFDQIKI